MIKLFNRQPKATRLRDDRSLLLLSYYNDKGVADAFRRGGAGSLAESASRKWWRLRLSPDEPPSTIRLTATGNP